MWTNENRARYDRSHLRYPSDLTDDEWKLVEPLIPPGRRGGDKRTVIMREVVNGLMYILSTGCQWRAIPKDLPPRSTLYDYFDLWSWDRTLDLIHHELYVKCREAIGREASPTAAVIDSQSVKSAEKGGLRLIRRATTRERRSRARSGTFSSIRKDWEESQSERRSAFLRLATEIRIIAEKTMQSRMISPDKLEYTNSHYCYRHQHQRESLVLSLPAHVLRYAKGLSQDDLGGAQQWASLPRSKTQCRHDPFSMFRPHRCQVRP